MFIRQCMRRINGKRQAYWAVAESYRTARGPRQRVVAWLGKLDEAGRLGVQQAAQTAAGEPTVPPVGPGLRQQMLFEEETQAAAPRWVEVNARGIRVENCRQFGGPWLALELIRRLQLDTFLGTAMSRGQERIAWPPEHADPDGGASAGTIERVVHRGTVVSQNGAARTVGSSHRVRG